jgi:hypothetical protein
MIFKVRANPLRHHREPSRHLAPGGQQAWNWPLRPDGDNQGVWTNVPPWMETRSVAYTSNMLGS